jgi:hypothetical protein
LAGALPGPDSGVRPIAIGEVWCRLAGLCALSACADVGRDLAPLQLAVGISGEVEAAVHAVKAALSKDRNAALLSVDMANAFNTVSRSAVFAAVQERAPSLLPYVQWSYGAATDLHIVGAPEGTPPVLSSAGVRQGDTLGTFLFALALQRPLEHTREEANRLPLRVAVTSFADDVYLIGREDGLRVAFATLTRDAADIGLKVQERKCTVFGSLPQHARLAADLGALHCPDGVTVCGTPIGAGEHVASALDAKAQSVVTEVERLMRLPLRKQSKFILLQRSMSLRMAHLMRTMPWEQAGPSTQRVEAAICDAVQAIFKVPPHGVHRERDQMLLPLRHAGLGLRLVQPIEADAALVSGAAKAHAAMVSAPGALQPFSGAARAPLLEAWQRVFDYGAAACEWPPDAAAAPARDAARVLHSIRPGSYGHVPT